MVKVSVIVPVYNAGEYLEQCMSSIRGQTLENIQIICVDDGSTDDSLEILTRHAKEDDRIEILSQKNQYAGVARNHGMKHANGKYLSFLDADDYFESDMLEKMYQQAEANQVDVVMCRYAERLETKDNITFPDWAFIDSFFDGAKKSVRKNRFSGKQLNHAGLFQISRGWAWDKLFRTDFVRRCGYEYQDFRSSEDGYFVYMLLTRARQISYMDNIFITHRIDLPHSLSNTKEKDWMNGFMMFMMIKRELEQQGIYELYQQSFLNEVISFMSWYLESMRLFEAYTKVYAYIKESMEPIIKALNHSKSYYFQEQAYEWYEKVNSLPLEEYLFEERKRTCDIIQWQKGEIQERDWVFPYHVLEKSKKVILYGAGKIGRAYHAQLVESGFCEELTWVDKEYKKYTATGLKVESPDLIEQKEFDYVFVSIKNKETQDKITEELVGKGVPTEKIKYYHQYNG